MIDAVSIAQAVRSVPGVVDLHSGPFGTASTFTNHGRIWGIRTGPETIDVHIVTEATTNALVVAAAVRVAIANLDGFAAAGLPPISVHIEDIRAASEINAADTMNDITGRIA